MEESNRLPECEEMIMSVIWNDEEDLDLHQVTDITNAKFGKDWKIQTVSTFLTRLEKKKYISIYRIGRYSHYHAEVKRDVYRKIVLEEVAERLFDDDFRKMSKFIKEM